MKLVYSCKCSCSKAEEVTKVIYDRGTLTCIQQLPFDQQTHHLIRNVRCSIKFERCVFLIYSSAFLHSLDIFSGLWICTFLQICHCSNLFFVDVLRRFQAHQLLWVLSSCFIASSAPGRGPCIFLLFGLFPFHFVLYRNSFVQDPAAISLIAQNLIRFSSTYGNNWSASQEFLFFLFSWRLVLHLW